MTVPDATRLMLWQALSTLFLDTEVSDSDIACIAKKVCESGCSPQQIQRILWAEVYPVLSANLRSVAGEWVGWSDEWLLANLRIAGAAQVHPARGSVAREIARCWRRVAERLPPGY